MFKMSGVDILILYGWKTITYFHTRTFSKKDLKFKLNKRTYKTLINNDEPFLMDRLLSRSHKIRGFSLEVGVDN